MLKDKIKELFDKKHIERTSSYVLVVAVYLIIQVLMLTGNVTNTAKALLIPVCCYIVAALALNLVTGVLGDLCLGQAGFMSVGAFSGIVAAAFFARFINNEIIVLILSILVGGLFAAICGIIIGVPVLKLQGDYLAIVTLAFCEIIKSIVNNLYVGIDSLGIHMSFLDKKFDLLDNGEMIIKGAIGGSITNRISSFTAGVILVIITLIIIYNLMYSKSGRAIMACRDNKIAASSVGVDVSKYKLLTFVISATLAGMAGVIYALSFSSIKSVKFDFNLSIMILVYVVLGGLGNMRGTLVSTTLLLVLPEALRFLQDYRMIIYAMVLIIIMLVSNNEKLKTLFKKKKGEQNG